MVYRGCADPDKLPLGVYTGVTPDENCKYQGPRKSLWWFCQGKLCNIGQLGEDVSHCASPPPPKGYERARRPYLTPSQPPPIQPIPREEKPQAAQDHQIAGVLSESDNFGYLGRYSADGSPAYFFLPYNVPRMGPPGGSIYNYQSVMSADTQPYRISNSASQQYARPSYVRHQQPDYYTSTTDTSTFASYSK